MWLCFVPWDRKIILDYLGWPIVITGSSKVEEGERRDQSNAMREPNSPFLTLPLEEGDCEQKNADEF